MTLEEMRVFIALDQFATERCGIRVDSLDENEAVLSMQVETHHLNGNGVVQGGAIYTLCDTAFAVAANAGKARMVNRSAEITYLKPGNGPVLYARAKCVSQGKTMGLYQIEAYDSQGTLIAFMAANAFSVRSKD
jgi:acyl-CoA thioesterase